MSTNRLDSRLVGFTREDVHALPASDQGPTNAVSTSGGVIVGSDIVLSERNELSGGTLVGGSEWLIPRFGVSTRAAGKEWESRTYMGENTNSEGSGLVCCKPGSEDYSRRLESKGLQL